jgi:predicted Fe-Mo cluster-binding NifX family protein
MTPKELIAVPTEGDRGIKDRVSGVFAKAPYFTFVEVLDRRRGEVSVQENEALKLVQGTGPMVMKNLKDRGVDVVLAGDVGPGAKTLMEISGIRLWKIEAGTKVSKALNRYIESQS